MRLLSFHSQHYLNKKRPPTQDERGKRLFVRISRKDRRIGRDDVEVDDADRQEKKREYTGERWKTLKDPRRSDQEGEAHNGCDHKDLQPHEPSRHPRSNPTKCFLFHQTPFKKQVRAA